MKLKCVAIDDEPVALSIIRRYCERRGNMEIEVYSSSRMGMRRVLEWHPDIVFLDIELNGASGVELARGLPQDCCLIFTTAYARYALEGFEVNAVDFLHKPYFYDRFDRAVQKAETWLRMNDLLKVSDSASRCLFLKSDYKNVSVPFDRILYIESIDNYVRIHTVDGTAVQSKIPLWNIEEQLPDKDFVRIHRSFLVAASRIFSFTRSQIVLEKGGKQLPVGKKYADSVMAFLKGRKDQ